MAGFTLTEFLLFGKQLGIALAGAAALWGAIISLKDFHCGQRKCVIYDWIAVRLLPLFLVGLGIGTVSYLGLLATVEVFAHEGIAYLPTAPEVAAAFPILTPLFIGLLALTLVAITRPQKGGDQYANWITYFFAGAFAFCFAITAVPAWRGVVDGQQLFYAGHGFHSIFTVGSVLVLDYLFIMSKRAQILKEHIFALFPKISAVVWFGLAFDFASALLIIEGFAPTTKLLFMQTVIGILIINGAILSGPLARKLMASLKEAGGSLAGKWRLAANVAGTVSITSWVTITFIDSFEHLTFSYLEFIAGYLALIAIIFAGHTLFEYIEERTEPPAFVHE